MGEDAAVAVGGGTVVAQLDILIGQHRLQRGAGGESGLGARAGFAGPGRGRNLDAGEPDFAPVIEQEAAPVDDRRDLARTYVFEVATSR